MENNTSRIKNLVDAGNTISEAVKLVIDDNADSAVIAYWGRVIERLSLPVAPKLKTKRTKRTYQPRTKARRFVSSFEMSSQRIGDAMAQRIQELKEQGEEL